ncbi:T9SS type A sorting domain-containing protein [candidate division KSB1 bacterium]|nr:T9SS type A sorting domain-containing protein [candidate division KSB1 bacterium]
MKKKSLLLVLFVLILFSTSSFSQKITTDNSPVFLKKPTGESMATLLNINKISLWANADGRLCYSPHENTKWGAFYPRGTAGVIYNKGDGILWGGFVKDGFFPELRVGGQRWSTGTAPGCILSKGIAENPNDSNVRIWRIRPDWQIADLTQDAAEFYNVAVDKVTQDQIETMRKQYENDWNDWPWGKGAPFYDNNNNGIMDQGEQPGLAFADQVIWFAANDVDSSVTMNLFHEYLGGNEYTPGGSLPIGLEMQVTLWAYNSDGTQLKDAFQNIVFKQVRLIYKGRSDTPDNAFIDSMFISQFVDTDIGDFADDYAGCDTVLQLGYGYNSVSLDNEFQKAGLQPPAVGYSVIQGPIVPSADPADKAIFAFRELNGFKNLNMTSLWHKAVGSSWSTPLDPVAMYNVMNGFLTKGDGSLIQFWDCNGNPTKFMVSGDPVNRTGCIDGMPHVHPSIPSDRRVQLNFGPFNMALGDTQEVIIAIVGGIGADRLSSVSVMKHYVKWARFWAQTVFKTGLEKTLTGETLIGDEALPQDFRLYQNYPNPFNAGTNIRYDLPIQRDVKLTIHNLLGQTVKVLLDKKQDAGSFAIHWDGTDSFGKKLPSGIYLYKLQAGYWTLTKKMMLLQ